MRLLWSFIRRDAAMAASYRAGFVLPLASIFVTVPMIYFIAQVFAGSDAPALQAFRGDYFAFLLLGLAFQDYVALSMSSFLNGIRDHQLMGTLEIVMLSPTPVSRILLCSSAWGYVFTSIRFALYVLLGLAFGVDLSQANLISFALLTLAAIISFAALGVLGAAATLLLKQASAITTFLTVHTLAFGGVTFPIEVLPAWLQKVAWLLPFTHALSGVRKALLLGATPLELHWELLVLFAFALVLSPVAIWSFHLALHRAKATGTLAQY